MTNPRVEAACRVLEKQGWRFDDDRDRAAVRRALAAADRLLPKYEQVTEGCRAHNGFCDNRSDEAVALFGECEWEPVYRKVEP